MDSVIVMLGAVVLVHRMILVPWRLVIHAKSRAKEIVSAPWAVKVVVVTVAWWR
jgi:hypothetical protein